MLTIASLSEFGCITNPPRDFGEIQALYSSQMTPVYSGGLVYEYSNEPSNPGFGLVNIQGSSVSPKNPDFNNLMKMLKANVPEGNGGYKTNGQPFTDCPAFSSNWNVKLGNGLPALPNGAMKYMTSGAGAGPGLSGSGSQTAGDGSEAVVTQTAANAGYTAGSSSSSSSSSSGSGSGNSAFSVQPMQWQGPLVAAAAVFASSAFGLLLL